MMLQYPHTTITIIIINLLISVVNCGEPPEIFNGTVTSDSGATTFGSTASYQCDEGFLLSDTDTAVRTCEADGQWLPVLTCERTYVIKTYSLNNSVDLITYVLASPDHTVRAVNEFVIHVQ